MSRYQPCNIFRLQSKVYHKYHKLFMIHKNRRFPLTNYLYTLSKEFCDIGWGKALAKCRIMAWENEFHHLYCSLTLLWLLFVHFQFLEQRFQQYQQTPSRNSWCKQSWLLGSLELQFHDPIYYWPAKNAIIIQFIYDWLLIE